MLPLCRVNLRPGHTLRIMWLLALQWGEIQLFQITLTGLAEPTQPPSATSYPLLPISTHILNRQQNQILPFGLHQPAGIQTHGF